MSKVTVITDAHGNIAAVGHGHLSEETFKKTRPTAPPTAPHGVYAGLRAVPGQSLRELDLSDDVSDILDFGELVRRVQPHLR